MCAGLAHSVGRSWCGVINSPSSGDHFRRRYQTAPWATFAATRPSFQITLGKLVSVKVVHIIVTAVVPSLLLNCASVTVFSNAEVDVADWCLRYVIVVGDGDTDKAHSTQVLARHQTAQVSTELACCQHRVTVLLDSAGSLSLFTLLLWTAK